jgi:hypothetical protein
MIPTVNLDNMREELLTADVMTRFSITTEEGLAAWLSDINQGLAARSNEEWLATRPNRGRGSSVSTASYLKAINKVGNKGGCGKGDGLGIAESNTSYIVT